MIKLNKIYEAKRQIADFVIKTPLSHSYFLSQFLGRNVYLKSENLQITGAYKIRGAFNKIANLSKEQKALGVIAASAGNHAQGVALAARHFGIEAVIVMPESTPLLKVIGAKNLGARVILKGDNFDEAFSFAKAYAKEKNLTFIHPFEDEEVMAGQGTIALEIFDELANTDMIIAPVGGADSLAV